MKLNLTIVFIVACVFGMATIGGIVVLDIDHVDTATFVGIAGSILTSLLGFGATIAGLNYNNKATDTVKANVNGNLTKLIDIATGNATATVADVQALSTATGATPTVKSTPLPTSPTVEGSPSGPVS